jgi:hypothetical protein
VHGKVFLGRHDEPSCRTILFITGYAVNAAVGHGHLAPGMQILAKPFVIAALVNKVREMMEVAETAASGPA